MSVQGYSINDLLVSAKSECLNQLDGMQSGLRMRVTEIFDELISKVKVACDANDKKHVEELRIREEEFKAKVEEIRYQCKEELQDHIDDLVEELAACKEDSAADRQTIQHLVAVVAKLIK